MNLAALWVICYLFRPNWRMLTLVALFSATMIGTGLLLSSLSYYLGLSGVLHAIFAFWALRESLEGRKSSWLLVLGGVMKVAWELYFGGSAATSALIEANVAVQAHAIGLVAGLGLALLVHYRKAAVKA